MMMMKICPRCNTKHSYNETCPNSCFEKAKQERNKIYDKTQRKNSDFYKSKEWVRLTAECKHRFNGLDIFQLYEYEKIIPGSLSHHIIEINDDESRKLDIDNLIWLSEESHRQIHRVYNQSELAKETLQELLFFYVEKYKKDFA